LIKQVIIDASPLIVFFKSNQAELFPQLFDEIYIPEAVWEEVTTVNDVAGNQLPSMSWLQRKAVDRIAPKVASWDLGKGESAVLSLGLEYPDFTLIVDDRAARRCAKTLALATLGTGGVLILAKRRGLISEVKPRLEALQSSGLWLSDALVELVQKQAGE
jgi:predicted nucleic acid-binding protein